MVEPAVHRMLTIIAKDPGLRLGGPGGPMAFAQVSVPAEVLAKGPTGYRIKVVDYNATEQRAYLDRQDYQGEDGALLDPFAPSPDESVADASYEKRLLGDPNFHAQNVYAIAMRTLGVFERALGRRVSWSSGGHQLHVAPHAFAQANAFYSEPDRALMFGYFYDDDRRPVFTCLSHDIVAHETTHALLDGLRSRYTEPSGPDQAAFHEGFADIVALLSIFSLKPVVAAAIHPDSVHEVAGRRLPLVSSAKLEVRAIRESILLGLARQVGEAIRSGERAALRRSVEIEPEDVQGLNDDPDEHARGEVLVAAMMNGFIELWRSRIEELGQFGEGFYNLNSVVDEGAEVAGQLLNMAVRALDYCPPTDVDFGQYLTAMLTADRELVPDDDRGYRAVLAAAFARYGIVPPSETTDAEGCWLRHPADRPLVYARSNFQAMTRSKDEFFRFLWENRDALGVSDRAYTEVLTVDPASRVGPDGIALHETVCQYIQRADMFGAEFESVLETDRPEGMQSNQRYTAFGGGVVILDQYGQVKYHIANRIQDPARQHRRAQYLIDTGAIGPAGPPDRLRFGVTHQHRMGG